MLPRQDASAYSPTALLEVQHPLKEGREEDCAECNPDNSSVIRGIATRLFSQEKQHPRSWHLCVAVRGL